MAALPANDRLTGPLIAAPSQTDFDADFPLIAADPLDPPGVGVEVRVDRAGTWMILALDDDFSVLGPVETGFTVRLAEGAEAGDRIWIAGRLPTKRGRNHPPGGQTKSATLEADACQFAAAAQETRRDLARAVQAPIGESMGDLPGRDDRKGRYAAFDPVTGDLGAGASQVAFDADVAATAASAAAAASSADQAEGFKTDTAAIKAAAEASVAAAEATALAAIGTQQTTSVGAVVTQQTASVAAVTAQQGASLAAVTAAEAAAKTAVGENNSEGARGDAITAISAAAVVLADNLLLAPDLWADGIEVAFAIAAGAAGADGAHPLLARDRALLTYDPVGDAVERVRTRAEEDAAVDLRVRADIDTFAAFNEGVASEFQGPVCWTLPDGRGLAQITHAGRLVQLNAAGEPELVVLRSDIPGVGAGSTFALSDCPVVFVCGNSLDEDGFSIPNKSIGSILSGLTDWRIVNVSWSGHDPIELYQKVQEDVLRFGVTPRALKASFVLVSDTSNAALKQVRFSDYFTAMARLVGLWQALGASPILMSEPRSAVQAMSVDTASAPLLLAGQAALARRLGIPYWNRSDYQRVMEASRYEGYYSAHHGGLRAQRMMVDFMAARLAGLPRPIQSIKLYSPRGAPANAAALAFDTGDQMRARWIPAPVGHTALANADLARVDDLDGTAPGTQTINDSAGSVACTGYGLMRIVLPGTAATLDSVTVTDLPSGAVVRALSATPALSFDPSAQLVGYQVIECAVLPTVSPGATYNDGTYAHTVVRALTTADGRHLVVTTTANLRNSASALTFTRTGGTGDASFVSTRVRIGEHPDFYDSLGAPFRAWSDVGAVAGSVTITALQDALVGDVLTLLVEQAGAFTLTAPTVEWTGAGGKPMEPVNPPVLWPTGTQLLAEPDVLDIAGGWIAVDAAGVEGSTPASAAPADGWLPQGVTEVVEVTASAGLRQTFTPAPDARRNLDLTVLVWSRWFPALQSASDPFGTNGITTTSLDEVTLRVLIHKGDANLALVEEVRVGLAWKPAPVRFELPTSIQLSGDLTLDIYCRDGTAQIGRVEIWRGA